VVNNEQDTIDDFNTMSVQTAVLKNSFTAILAMLMVLIYNVADTFFIGQTHDALQVAAVSLATPVFLLFMAVGTVFGVGGTSVISRALGAGRQAYAKQVCSFCMWCCVVVGVLLSVLLWLGMDKIILLIGASSDTFDLVKTYLNIVTFSGPFVLIGNCYSNILRAEGQSTKATMGMLVGNLLNVILDPIMIIGLNWNIAGAAIATVIGNVVGALYYLLYFAQGKSSLSINPKDFTMGDKVAYGVLSIGIPASLGSLLMSVSAIVLNSQMTEYGDMALAGIGVAAKVTMITGMVCIGLGQGVQPLLGYSVGAGNWSRYREIMHISILLAFGLGVVMTGLCYIFVERIVGAFLTDKNALAYGIMFSKIFLTTSVLFGVFYVLVNALQALGAAFSSLIINISRQGLIYIPVLLFLKKTWGIQGLVWAQPVTDVLSLVLVFILYYKSSSYRTSYQLQN